jgi:hypothetical protein
MAETLTLAIDLPAFNGPAPRDDGAELARLGIHGISRSTVRLIPPRDSQCCRASYPHGGQDIEPIQKQSEFSQMWGWMAATVPHSLPSSWRAAHLLDRASGLRGSSAPSGRCDATLSQGQRPDTLVSAYIRDPTCQTGISREFRHFFARWWSLKLRISYFVASCRTMALICLLT